MERRQTVVTSCRESSTEQTAVSLHSRRKSDGETDRAPPLVVTWSAYEISHKVDLEHNLGIMQFGSGAREAPTREYALKTSCSALA